MESRNQSQEGWDMSHQLSFRGLRMIDNAGKIDVQCLQELRREGWNSQPPISHHTGPSFSALLTTTPLMIGQISGAQPHQGSPQRKLPRSWWFPSREKYIKAYSSSSHLSAVFPYIKRTSHISSINSTRLSFSCDKAINLLTPTITNLSSTVSERLRASISFLFRSISHFSQQLPAVPHSTLQTFLCLALAFADQTANPLYQPHSIAASLFALFSV